jgi:hypothetical protein
MQNELGSTAFIVMVEFQYFFILCTGHLWKEITDLTGIKELVI